VTTTPDSVHPVRRPVSEEDSRRANREDWDAYADEYQTLHGDFLGDVGFVWGPEGLQEAEMQVLGDPAALAGRRALDLGSGAGQCARWLRSKGAEAYGLDLSERQLQHSLRLDDHTGVTVPSVCATATQIPFGDGTFDIVFSSFGALQFVAEAELMVAEVARVLRLGGTFAFSVTHPLRWSMPDDAGPEGLTIVSSYWDRTPYVEEDETGQARYVEHHRTLGDWVGLLSGAGFCLRALHEPEWPEGLDRIWGGWGPLRGRLVPGTAIFVAELSRAAAPGCASRGTLRPR
jgi:SAM-dependent methyltransferase